MTDIEAVIRSLETAPALVLPLVREVPAARIKIRPKPEKWSAHEHACHLAVAEGLFASRIERILTEERPKIVPFNPASPDVDDSLLGMDLEEALESYSSLRAKNVERLGGLSPADWAREAEHPEYARYSLKILARHFALHDLFHAYRIEQAYLAR
jgi:hypothetical protein